MKYSPFFLAAVLILTSCIHDLQNPSDPDADKYSGFSRATVRLKGSGFVRVGDTVFFAGGSSSTAVDAANLISRYQWDFDGNGTVDTTIAGLSEASWVYPRTGTYTCRLLCADRAGYRDSASVKVTVQSASWGLTFKLILHVGDTLRVTIDRDTPYKVVSAKGDTVAIIPSLTEKSVSVVNLSGDTVAIPLVGSPTVSIMTIPIDTIKPPAKQIYIPEFPALPGFPDSLDGDCAFFAADSSLMHTNLNFYNVMWEQTKADGLEALDFVEKMISDVTGYSIITLAAGKYTYTFSRGVYSFSSGNFKISCAFHYGAGLGSHSENDTVKADLFAYASYISGIKTNLNPPSYSFTPGPLFELIDGEVSIDQSLNVSFSVNFSKLKVSFYRKSVSAFTALPFYIVNDSLRLQTTHTSYARMAPVYMLQFSSLFHNDSILIDHSGTAMTAEPELLDVIYKTGDTYLKATYSFSVKQVMDRQQTAYGNRDGILKLSGNYAATSTLGFNGYDQSVYFGGRYSSTVSDSSWFYCDFNQVNEFGTLFFGEIADSVGIFTSEKYGYSFPYTPQQVKLAQYRKLIQ